MILLCCTFPCSTNTGKFRHRASYTWCYRSGSWHGTSLQIGVGENKYTLPESGGLPHFLVTTVPSYDQVYKLFPYQNFAHHTMGGGGYIKSFSLGITTKHRKEETLVTSISFPLSLCNSQTNGLLWMVRCRWSVRLLTKYRILSLTQAGQVAQRRASELQCSSLPWETCPTLMLQLLSNRKRTGLYKITLLFNFFSSHSHIGALGFSEWCLDFMLVEENWFVFLAENCFAWCWFSSKEAKVQVVVLSLDQ